MCGPCTQDCKKSIARTGTPSASMILKKAFSTERDLVQIAAFQSA
jgi:hypothetical protein